MEKEIVKRLAPSKETLNLLFSFSGNECAFPGCTHLVYNEKNKLIAQVCHIESASEGGERFNPDSNNEDRRHFDNLIILCYVHHVETDDVMEYPTEKLREMKTAHEGRCQNRFIPSLQQIDNAFEVELRKAYERIEQNTELIIDNQNTQVFKLEALDAGLTSILEILTEKGSTITDYNKKIDEIFLLRAQQQQRTAISLFDNLQSADWTKMSGNEKYRLLVLKGVCHLDLNEQEIAKGLFLEGYGYQQENAKAIYYGILGYMLAGDEPAALTLVKKGLEIDPLNSGIVSARIRMQRGKSQQDILAMIPEGMKSDPEVAFEVSACMLNIKLYDEAISWNQIALKHSSGPYYDLKAALATVILESIFDHFRVFTNQITQEMKNKAEYILQLYNEAWKELSFSELRISRSWYLLNRGIVKKLLDNLEGYYDDTVEAHRINPDFATTRHLFLVSNELNYVQKANGLIDNMKILADQKQIHEVYLFEARQLLDAGKPDAGLKLLKKLLAGDLNDVLREVILLDIVSYYIDTKEYELAQSFNLQLASLIPDEISFLTLQARIDAARGHVDFAKALLTIFRGIKGHAKKSHLEVLASDLAKAGLIQESIILNERITDISVYSSQSVNLINLYLNAGENGKVLQMATSWLEKYGPIRDVNIVVAHVYERINDVKSAITFYQSYLKVYPNDQQIRYQLAVIYRQENNRDLLKDELLTFDHLDHHLSMDAQYNLAVMFHECGFIANAYDFAYQTRHQFFDLAASHDRFVALSTTFDQSNNHPLDPSFINDQCAVILETDGVRHDYLIQERSDPVRSRGEILPESFEAKALFGKKAGETANLSATNSSSISNILAVQHLYNYAFVQSMDMSFTVFAGETKMRRMQIGSTGEFREDFKDLFKNLDELEEYNASIEQNYATGNLPIGALAMIRKENPINVWLTCISNPSMGVYTSSTAQEHFKASSMLSQPTPILVDIISLCTIFFTEVHPFLSKLPNTLILSAASMNEINDLISELEKKKNVGSITLGKNGGAYIRHITTPEDIDRQLARFVEMKNWVEDNCEVLPCTSALKMNAHEKAKFDKVIGECFVDSMLTAKEYNAILLSEEASFRGLAFQEHGISGVGSFSLLLYLNNVNIISIEEYREATIKLIAMYYRIIPVTAQTLFKIAKKSSYKFNPVLENAFEGLLSDILPKDKGAEFGATLIMMIYTEKIDFIVDKDFEEYRRILCVKCLDVLCRKFIPISLESFLSIFYQNPTFIPLPAMQKVKRILADYFKPYH